MSDLIEIRSLTRSLTDRKTDNVKLKGTNEQFLIVYVRVTNLICRDQHVAFSKKVSLPGIFRCIKKKQLKISPLCIYLFNVNIQMEINHAEICAYL
jgi:preprotein translocase subunit SecB